MTPDEVKIYFNSIKNEVKEAKDYLKPEQLETSVREHEKALQNSEIWKNAEEVSKHTREMKDAKDTINLIKSWESRVSDVGVLFELYSECKDISLIEEAEKTLKKLKKNLKQKN